jgi:3-hydroxyisobutyrate dehydrogenase-like beta-hydroxyacid dehydrogenase
MKRVGMIGLGLMGEPLVGRLRALGHEVHGYDIDPSRCEAAAASGARIADSPADVAARSDLILISVTTTDAVRTVCLGANGIIAAPDGANPIVADLSTTEIDITREIAETLWSEREVAFLDCPVSGGPPACAAGGLAIMAGGADDAIAAARPVMEQLGTFSHMGPSGAGQATKLINQTLVLNNFVVIAEVMRLAEAYGVDARRVPDALAQGYAGSNLLPVMIERMAARDYTPTGYARQVLKDLEMVQAAGKAKGLAQPLTAQSVLLYRMMVGAGQGEIDGAGVLELLPEPKKT